jgi:peroxiredoxin
MDPIVSIDSQAPLFQLPDLKGMDHSLINLRGRIVVLTFWSAECTWCDRVDRELLTYLSAWKEQVEVWWIASNANESHELIEHVASERHLPTVLIDNHQEVADLYGAQTTPHFFMIDKLGKLQYQGAWDDITFRQRAATQVFVPQAVEALMNNQPLKVHQTPAYGCVLVRLYQGSH